MSKNVLIISSSPRKGGNSETLVASFAKGAGEAGHKVETIYLREKNYGFCKGCLACLKVGHCVIDDDAVEITAKMHDADVLVFATPVYYYSVSGQLKTMLDRANPLFDSDYAFTKAYLLATAAEDGEETVEGTVKAVQGWVDCFERCELVGTVFAGGVNGVGDIAGHPALEEAYGICAVIIVVLLLLCSWEKVQWLAAWLIDRLPHTEKWEGRKQLWKANLAALYIESRQLLCDRPCILKVLGLNGLKLCCLYCIPFLAMRILGLSGLSFWQVQMLAALMHLISNALPNVAGVGPVEFAFVLIFSHYMEYAQASSALILYRIATFFFPFILSVIVFLRVQKRVLSTVPRNPEA